MKIERENVFDNRIIFVDGMWGSGKSLLAPLLGLGQSIEKQKIDPNFEYICTLNYLKQLSEEAAANMLKIQSDLVTYSSYIAREVNFRFHDSSGVFNNPKKLKYFSNLFKKDKGNVEGEILTKKPILHIMSHNIFPVSKPLFRAFFGRLKLIVMTRNPVYMMQYWSTYLQRVGREPKELTLCIGDKGDVPWFIKDVKKFNNLTPMEKAIESYKDLSELQLEVEKEGFLNKDSLLMIPFESFTLDSKTWITKITDYLELDDYKKFTKFLSKINCPRAYLLEGIDKKVIRSKGNNLATLEKDNFDSILEEIKGEVSSSYFQDLIGLIRKYKEKYKFPRQMPWDDI
ncbi:MAG: hypothetical protein CMD78_01620 [Gammaproteobacteria bacterium]|nr:hypothetical protein [Gammaproteobacteria bacterium]|tara:strand:+ start:650 stop:1678 length:1029 start_codon:yes stop_codon:yes gene_type:complete